jgi:energy-coupling factor transporter ATP-binding protein EcfA2
MRIPPGYFSRRLGQVISVVTGELERRTSSQAASEGGHIRADRLTTREIADQNLLRELNPGNTIVILGEPGAGKSSLARAIAFWLAENRQGNHPVGALPILAQCGRLDFSLGGNVLDAILRAASPALPPRVLEAMRNKHPKHVVLILDAFDELAPERRRQLVLALQGFTGTVLITCREAVWDGSLERIFNDAGRNDLIRYTVQKLRPKEQREYLNLWAERLNQVDKRPDGVWLDGLYQRIQDNDQLQGLAENALLLRLIATTAHQGGVELPNSRAGFYERALTAIWNEKLDESSSPAMMDMLGVARDRFLPALALHLDRIGTVGEASSQDLEITATALGFEQGKWERLLNKLISTGLLVREGSERPTYSYLHRTFREYALAVALLDGVDTSEFQGRLLGLVQSRWTKRTERPFLGLALSIAVQREVSVTPCIVWLIEQGEVLKPEARLQSNSSPWRVALHLLRESGKKPPQTLIRLIMAVIGDTKSRRIALASDLRTPLVLLEELAGIKDNELRFEVASNPSTPANVLEELAKVKDTYVLSGVASHPSTPALVLKKLARSKDTNVQSAIVNNLSAPKAELMKFVVPSEDPMFPTNNPQAPKDSFEGLAKDERPQVRAIVASNVNAPASVLERLAQDEHFEVRLALASNPNAPASVLSVLVHDTNQSGRFGIQNVPAIIRKYWTQEKHLKFDSTDDEIEQFAQLGIGRIRIAVARNPNTPAMVLEELAKDKEDFVRIATVGNPNVPADVLQRIAMEGSKYERSGVAGNPSATAIMLRYLAKDIENVVQIQVQRNPNVHLEDLA